MGPDRAARSHSVPLGRGCRLTVAAASQLARCEPGQPVCAALPRPRPLHTSGQQAVALPWPLACSQGTIRSSELSSIYSRTYGQTANQHTSAKQQTENHSLPVKGFGYSSSCQFNSWSTRMCLLAQWDVFTFRTTLK